MSKSPLGLYLHIPFCSAICTYCNFNRGLYDADLKDRYLAALQRQIVENADRAPADTIFFGGGTPSLLDPDELATLIGACRAAFTIAADAEVTVEANPETVTPERLRGYRAAGVNRLSVGVQSFRDDELRRLGRVHSAAAAVDAVRVAREAGFDNVSLDLMLWLPEQRLDEARESVARLVDLAPDHASLYLLELYPNAPLREDMARAGWSLAPDDDAADMYLEAMTTLERAGYEQYEISNVARPGRRARHNLKYWQDGEWLGFGCGAHSTRGGRRWKNVSAVHEYIARTEEGADVAAEGRVLSAQARVEEAIFTALRLADGIDLVAFERRYGVNVWERYASALAPYEAAHLVARDGGRLRLTRSGMLVANAVLSVFV